MSEFGQCEQKGCEQEADVQLNGVSLCLAHFEERLKSARRAIEQVFGGWPR